MKKPLLTQKKYLKKLGQFCPFCAGDNVRGYSIEIQGDSAFQSCDCGDCGKGWTDEYKLVRFTPDEQ